MSVAATKKDYVTAVNLRVSLAAAAEASKAQIEQARIALGYSRITAPISGRAGAILVKAGNLISTANGTVPLVVINSVTPAEVQFSIPQLAFRQVRSAQAQEPLVVEVRDTGRKALRARGSLAFLDNAFNELSGTITLRARVPNKDEELWAGDFVAVRILLRAEPAAISIPEVALQQGQNGSYVYVAEADKARVQLVKVARIVDGRAVIAEGLSGGQRVVTRIPTNLRDGSPIEVRANASPQDIPVASDEPLLALHQRPVMTAVLTSALVFFGGFAFWTMPVNELPNVDFPTITVNVSLPGAAPETMASAVATPLERAFSALPGLDTLNIIECDRHLPHRHPVQARTVTSTRRTGRAGRDLADLEATSAQHRPAGNQEGEP